MSESTIRGTIKNFSPKPDENYYGLQIDKGNGETTWINGQGDPKDEWSKGDQVKVKVNQDEFIDIQEIIFLEDGDAGESTFSSQNAQGEGSSPSSFIQRDRSIMAQKALEEARKKHQDDVIEDPGKYMEKVTSTADGFFNWMKEKAEVEQ